MKEESTPYVGADSLKQIRVLSTFQFTRFQLTETICLLVSTRLSCFYIGNFKRGLSPALSPTNCKFNKNQNNTQPLLRKSCRIPHYKCINMLNKHVSSYFRCKGIEYSRTIQVHNGSLRKKAHR